jgi:hypothetical protein
MAVGRFGTVLLLAPLNIRTIRSILTASGLQAGLDRPLSTAVRLYSRCRSFQVGANVLHLKRSDVRLAMRRATKVLLASSNRLDRALGEYMHDLVDKAWVYGTGRSEIQ